jgi:hypothetical protein
MPQVVPRVDVARPVEDEEWPALPRACGLSQRQRRHSVMPSPEERRRAADAIELVVGDPVGAVAQQLVHTLSNVRHQDWDRE